MLETICKEEHFEADEDALLLIARQSTGALRDAISLLDQLASSGEKIDLNLAQVVLGTATNELVLELIDSIQKNDMAHGMETIHKALDSGSDPRQYGRQLVEYLRGLLMVSMGNEKQVEATKETKALMRQQSGLIGIPALMAWIGYFNEAINDLRTSWQPSLPLEIAFARSLAQDKTTTVHVTTPPPDVTPIEKKGVPKVKDSEPEIPQKVEPPQKKEEKTPAAANKKEVIEQEAVMEGALTTQDIQAAWSQIRAEVKLRRSQTEALLNSQRLLQVKNGILILGFSSEMLKSKMEIEENVEVTRVAIQKILDKDIPIHCVVVSNKATAEPDDLDVDAEGLVRAALNLGGKLIHKD